jgi:hypothetical protein
VAVGTDVEVTSTAGFDPPELPDGPVNLDFAEVAAG